MKGTVVYLFAFDVANEIRTKGLGEILSQKPFPFEIKLGAAAPRDVPVYAPLTVRMKPVECVTNLGPISLQPQVKVFEVGAISITYEVAFDKPSLADLVPYHQLTVDGRPLAALAEKLSEEVAASIKGALIKPNTERLVVEAYTAFCVCEIGGTVPEWVSSHRAAIAGLLNEEPESGRLAAQQIDETMQHSLAYTREDYAVIDWDAALIVDTGGYVDDVLYMLELANLQLEEYRLLDDRLDRVFSAAYDDLERRQSPIRFPFLVEKRLAFLQRTRMDITKMSEEVSNITKFVGDWYLARVYLACKNRFHLPQWEASVDQKLRELDSMYTLFHDKVNERRMVFLELVVIALIAFEVVAAFFRH